MSTIKYHDAAGRECKIFWPPETLSEADQNYHECGCGCEDCRKENTMDNPEYNDVVRFSTGREATYDELSKHHAGQTITALARQHMQRKGGTFSEALRAIAPICPGEFKEYLQYQLPDDSFLIPRGVKKVTEIVFRASEGWTEAGVNDWLKEQGFRGGDLIRVEGGWSYSPDPGQNSFPR